MWQGILKLIQGLFYVYWKEIKYYKYQIHIVQEMYEDNPNYGMQFCKEMQDLYKESQPFIRQNFFLMDQLSI